MRVAIMAVAAAITLVFAACGGGDEAADKETASATTSPTRSPQRTATPTKAATPAPTPKPTDPPRAGTRDNPVPVGTPTTLSDGWKLTVVSTQPDATAAVLAENRFNSPPTPGNQFFLVTVNVVRTGADPKAFSGSLYLKAVGPGNVGYTASGCGVYPGGDFNYGSSPELFTGGSTQGNVCWQIASGDAAGLVMYYDELFSLNNKDRVSFALH